LCGTEIICTNHSLVADICCVRSSTALLSRSVKPVDSEHADCNQCKYWELPPPRKCTTSTPITPCVYKCLNSTVT